ncbi:hypothetical protein R6Q57_001951 [Mikania cordata]
MATEEFCESYLVVDAKQANLFNIASILTCSTSFLNTKSFYEEQSEHVDSSIEDIISRRIIIFASMLAQKVLIWVEKPLALIGFSIELWLNLLSSNGGFLRLVINGILGKVVKPEELSKKFVTIVGELDQRLKLDASIRKGDERYNQALSMMAAKLSYENKDFVKAAIQDQLKMEFIGFYKFWNDYQNQFTTYATMFQDALDPNLIVVAFRGTEPFNAIDWRTDFDISWYELKDLNNSKPIGRIHGGFMKALGLQKIKGWPKNLEPQPNEIEEHPFAYYTIREKLNEILKRNSNAKFILTGHSLGAALAILFVGVLGLHEEALLLKKLEGVYTFGQPRVGDVSFGKYMLKLIKDHDVRYFRYVYSNDIVPRLPYDNRSLFFKHFGPSLFFDSFYNGKAIEEEPNKNYFSVVWFLPKYLTAFWEVIRSFILPYWKGKEYKESHTEKIFRLFGLIIPGIAAHSPKDYVDITRLGTEVIPTIINNE